jgi:hypothetical protein
MPHYGTFTLLDETGEKSAMKFYTGAITATSIGGFLTEFGDLRTATAAITRGTMNKERIVMDDTLLDAALPGDNLAQRENKLLVVYRDTTTNKLFTLTVPTIDLTQVEFMPGAGDNVSLSAPQAIVDWITAFETIGRSPDDDTHNVQVMQMRAIGRNV